MKGLCAVAIAAVAALCVAGGTVAAAKPRVLLIGDSVATGMRWHPKAFAIMNRGLDIDWEIAVCRTLTDPGCPYEGGRPPSLLDLVGSLGSVPPLVIVEVGYNDPLPTFESAVDQSMTALVAAGAQHVLWLTLNDARAPFPALNEVLEQATTRWPQLQLVDWETYAYNHPEWFQNDFVHLVEAGGIAMAHLVHGAVIERVDPLRITSAPLRLRAGSGVTMRLRAAGGTPPYRWSVAAGRPPRGFHLLANGSVTARLTPRAHASFSLAVTDSDGIRATIGASAG